MYKIKTVIAIATLSLLSFASAGYAADPVTKQPLDQAIESVDQNLAKDPDNKGLQNAADRLQTNQQRQQEKRAEQEAKRQAKAADKEAKRQAKTADKEAKRQAKIDKRAGKMSDHHDAERMEKMDRPEKAERPEKMERQNR